jgi:hypothetical protein
VPLDNHALKTSNSSPLRGASPMTVAELIKTLEALPPQAPVALRTVLPNQRVRWDDIERVELRGPAELPPVALIR